MKPSLLSRAAHYAPCPIFGEGMGELSPDYPLPVSTSRLMQLHEVNALLLQLPQSKDMLKRVETYAMQIRRRCDRLVLVGIGGSSLGARALTSLASAGDPMAFHIMDNPDPASVAASLNACDPHRTFWLFVSKSGSTLETLSQTLIVLKWLEERVDKGIIQNHCALITGPGASPLRALADHYGFPILEHIDLGGRWASLSVIGLLPAACCGVDVRNCLQGADAVVKHVLTAATTDNQPLQGALFAVRQSRASRPIHVLMPYTDCIDLAPWYGQLISESLGKKGEGITLLAARGTLDQHSTLQLMLDGPDDKFFTLIAFEHAGKGERIPVALAQICQVEYLAGQPIGNVLAAFQEGTLASLQASGRPVRVIRIPGLDAYHLGALMMYFMLETLYMAELFGVNPFDQPAVEDSKTRATAILKNNVVTLREKHG